MVCRSIIGAICTCLAVVSFNTNAALVSRLGGLAYYDDVTDLTWLADANSAGSMNWSDANAWAENLNVSGVTGWRLPKTVASAGYTGGYDYACTDSEMCNFFYNVLGGSQNVSIGITHNSNYDLFANWTNAGYWSATEYSYISANDSAWWFMFFNGAQNIDNNKNNLYGAWAVYSGDVNDFVSAVPVPAAVWLFGSGLIGLAGVARRKNKQLCFVAMTSK